MGLVQAGRTKPYNYNSDIAQQILLPATLAEAVEQLTVHWYQKLCVAGTAVKCHPE